MWHILATLSSAIGDAVRQHQLPANVVRPTVIPRPASGERTIWTPAQAIRFLHHCHANDPDFADLIEFLIGTGLRKGEALGLHWEDVHLAAHTIYVRWTLSAIDNNKLALTRPKTRKTSDPAPHAQRPGRRIRLPPRRRTSPAPGIRPQPLPPPSPARQTFRAPTSTTCATPRSAAAWRTLESITQTRRIEVGPRSLSSHLFQCRRTSVPEPRWISCPAALDLPYALAEWVTKLIVTREGGRRCKLPPHHPDLRASGRPDPHRPRLHLRRPWGHHRTQTATGWRTHNRHHQSCAHPGEATPKVFTVYIHKVHLSVAEIHLNERDIS